MSLAGKTVLVTGASRGIGAAIAQKALEDGANVVLTARDVQRLREVASFSQAPNERMLIVPGDITVPEFQQQLVNAAVERYKCIDVLVPNAGVVKFAPFSETTEEVLDYHLTTNYTSVVHLCRRVIPHIPSGGSIVFIATSITHGGFPALAAYSASKGAITALMRTLAVELASRGIAVNAVSPGPTQTELWARALPPEAIQQVGAKILPRLLTGEFGNPREVAETVVFLAQRKSIRGQDIVIDSGYTVS